MIFFPPSRIVLLKCGQLNFLSDATNSVWIGPVVFEILTSKGVHLLLFEDWLYTNFRRPKNHDWLCTCTSSQSNVTKQPSIHGGSVDISYRCDISRIIEMCTDCNSCLWAMQNKSIFELGYNDKAKTMWQRTVQSRPNHNMHNWHAPEKIQVNALWLCHVVS
jgi:hypothetical protein